MLTLLSPAKKLDTEIVPTIIPPTEPQFLKHTEILAKEAKKLSVQDLQDLMKLSDNLAQLNADRFKGFVLNGRSNSAKPAALSFNGNVYEGLDAGAWSKPTMQYAQSHLRILSGLYGVLRPMDSIQPYRLEMGRKLKTARGSNLYQFWGNTIAEALMENMKSHKEKAILNLASNEYFKSVDKKALCAPVLEVKFLNVKDGNARNLMYYAKRARGLMARWVMEKQINKAANLQGFNLDSYKFSKNKSSDNLLVFSRKQPPPKN
ncbi:MAG: peroxide stress protein YaaA [Robiginitomaculum sp.]